MMRAGELDPTDDDGVPTPNWSLTIALAVVIVVALLAGAVALADSAPPRDSVRASAAPATVGGTVVSRTTDAPTTVGPTTAVPAPSAPETEPPVAEPPSTEVPTTTPTVTEPPATAPPATAPPTAPPTPAPEVWLAVTDSDSGFGAEFPAQPAITVPMVRTPTGSVGRTEYNVDGPGGCRMSVTSMPAKPRGQAVDAFLRAVAGQVERDVSGTLTLGDARTVSGAPSLPFTIVVPGGRIRAEVVYAKGRLFTVSMFAAGSGAPGAPADAAFDRLVTSFHLT